MDDEGHDLPVTDPDAFDDLLGDAFPSPPRYRPMLSRAIMAAMLGLADVFGVEKPNLDEIVQVAPDPTTGDVPLDYGDLPPLD